MTTVKFSVKNNYTFSYTIEGHADYSDGDDIVCSAISSCAYMVANTITEIYHIDADITVDDDGFFELIMNIDDAKKCQEIMNGLKLHLNELAQQYPNNIVCLTKTLS